MLARRCDVCGEYYNIIQNEKSVIEFKISGASYGDRYDLCPACIKSFKSWLNSRRLIECEDISGECILCHKFIDKFNNDEHTIIKDTNGIDKVIVHNSCIQRLYELTFKEDK